MEVQHKQHYFIQGPRITFRPYCRKYVKEYHSWFDKDPELLYLTGSEPLSLEEEYQNHKSWLEDPSKYTFLIFNEQGSMIGDINLFFSEWIEPNQVEINIMIAIRE
jgi:RimJ/RimL family protein N-acetyltransferase